VAYRVVPIPMTWSDFEGHFNCVQAFKLPYLGRKIYHVFNCDRPVFRRESERPCGLEFFAVVSTLNWRTCSGHCRQARTL